LNELAYAPRGFGPLSLTLEAGQVVLLCGPSGSGKSTLCGLLAGELEASTGQVVRGQGSVGTMTADVESQLLGSTVSQELELGRRAQGVAAPETAELRDVRQTLLERWRGREGEDPHLLSLGEQQLLLLSSLAQGLFPLLILDEGLSCLDHVAFQEVCHALRALTAAGTLVLLVSHELRVLPWVDRCVGLEAGQLAFDKPATELTWSELARVKMWRGTLMAQIYPGDAPVLRPETSGLVLSPPRLGVSRSGPSLPLMAFDGQEVELAEGAVLAVAGAAGTGKSRLLATLLGAPAMQGFHSHVQGYAVLLPQQASSILPGRTVRAEFEASLAEGRRRGKTPAGLKDLTEIPEDWMARSPRSLSHGQVKLVACLCLLLQSPELLLLDEPFAGLDAQLRAVLEGRLRDHLAATKGRAVFSTHSPDEMVLYPSRLLVLEGKARPAYEGNPGDYFHTSPDARLGLPYILAWRDLAPRHPK
jgi:energy-coupling factor transport system ATP-binding protein